MAVPGCITNRYLISPPRGDRGFGERGMLAFPSEKWCPTMHWKVNSIGFFTIGYGRCKLRPSRGGGGGGTCPFSPRKKWPCSPKTKSWFFYVSCSPKLPVFPCSPYFLGLCSPVPLKKMPLFPKTPGRACKLAYFRRGELAHLYSTNKHFLK